MGRPQRGGGRATKDVGCRGAVGLAFDRSRCGCLGGWMRQAAGRRGGEVGRGEAGGGANGPGARPARGTIAGLAIESAAVGRDGAASSERVCPGVRERGGAPQRDDSEPGATSWEARPQAAARGFRRALDQPGIATQPTQLDPRATDGYSAPVWIAARGAVLVWALGAFGCHFNNVCGTSQQELLADGGSAYECLTSEDCPRAGNVFVCVSDGDPERRCVRCSKENRCLLLEPQFCR